MSYYDNPQWSTPTTAPPNNNWEHQSGATTPVRAGASGPQPQDDYAFSYQFDEVDRAYENLAKSGKGYGVGGRREFPARPMGSARFPPGRDGRAPHGPGPRSHSVNNFDDARVPQGPQGPNLQNFYATQRHQPSRGSNEAEQVMQAKRRMAAQRERELRNLHTEQQYQRTALTEAPLPTNKQMSEEETRELIARQRSALYGEGPFAEKAGYIDETGAVRPGIPGHSGPSSLRGHSPLTFDGVARPPPSAEARTPASVSGPTVAPADQSSRPQSITSPQAAGPTNRVFDNTVGPQSRTSTSSPTGASPSRDMAPGGSKSGQAGASVAPIGTRPSGTPTNNASKRSGTPLTSPSAGGWGRQNSVWGHSSGLGAPASVWG